MLSVELRFHCVTDAGADVNIQDAEGVTALHIAALNEHVDCVKMLLEHEANVSARSTEGWTPLHTVAQSGHLDCVKLLLQYGADPNERTKGECWTPLDVAAEKGHTQCVNLLLQQGAKVLPSTLPSPCLVKHECSMAHSLSNNPYPESNQSNSSYSPISLRSILISSLYLRLGFPRGISCRFICYNFEITPMTFNVFVQVIISVNLISPGRLVLSSEFVANGYLTSVGIFKLPFLFLANGHSTSFGRLRLPCWFVSNCHFTIPGRLGLPSRFVANGYLTSSGRLGLPSSFVANGYLTSPGRVGLPFEVLANGYFTSFGKLTLRPRRRIDGPVSSLLRSQRTAICPECQVSRVFFFE